MWPCPRVSRLFLLALALTGCGQHLSERLPNLDSAKGKGGGVVNRDLAQNVELAIQKGQAASLEAYLASGFPVNQPLNTGYTPLQQAIVSTKASRFEEVFRVLSARGADPLVRNAHGTTAMELARAKRVAARLLQPERNEELLRQFFADLEAEEERSRVVSFFTDEGEDVNVIDPGSGHTPLTLAIALKRRKLFAPFLEELAEDVDLSKPNGHGKTPLAVAREMNWNLAIAKLVELGAKE